jgi:hypothetical protein
MKPILKNIRNLFFVCMFILLGIALGLYLSSSVKMENKITLDALTSAIVAILAIIAATIILPLLIQPLVRKQSYVVSCAREDIDALLKFIDGLLAHCEDMFESSSVSEKNRKVLMSKYTKMINRASVLKKQVNKIDALKDFDQNVYQKLISTKADIAEKAVARRKLREPDYLSTKGNLEAVSDSLREIKYDLE